MGQWKPGIGSAAGRSGNARDDFEGNVRGNQCFEFFSAASEDEGVATFQANNRQALAGKIDQQLVD